MCQSRSRRRHHLQPRRSSARLVSLASAYSHSGISDESAPAPIDLLYELRANRPDLFDKIEIMIDGGVRSGADVVKALALGAKAVGLGRPFLYANGTHGQEGVVRVCQSKSHPLGPKVHVRLLSSPG
jgi:isopentenyl diphosphate isomerase/L-lactate dehydrogenase-like FMN-dependent dehydrogenase